VNSLYLYANLLNPPDDLAKMSVKLEETEASALALEVENKRLREALVGMFVQHNIDHKLDRKNYRLLCIACEASEKALSAPSSEPSKLMAVVEAAIAFKKDGMGDSLVIHDRLLRAVQALEGGEG